MHEKNATYYDKHVSSWKCIFFVVESAKGFHSRAIRPKLQDGRTGVIDEHTTAS